MSESGILSPQPGFLTQWAGWYPDSPPIGFLLREAYAHRWLRIHSLPLAKRNPTSGYDYAEIIRRHNEVATDVLGIDAQCVLVIVAPCTDGDVLAQRSGLGDSPLFALGQLESSLWDERDGVFAVPMCFYGGITTWRSGSFNLFLSAAAQDFTRAIVVETSRGQVFAPYNGGVDLFFASQFERDLASQRYAKWLSSRCDGL